MGLLRTHRLALRRMAAADLDNMLGCWETPEVVRYTAPQSPETRPRRGSMEPR